MITLVNLAVTSILYLQVLILVRTIVLYLTPFQTKLTAHLQAKRLIFQRKKMIDSDNINAQKRWLEEAKDYLKRDSANKKRKLNKLE